MILSPAYLASQCFPRHESVFGRYLRFLFGGSETKESSMIPAAGRFESVAREYTSLIERICFGYASTLAELEDLKQDVLLNLWESMPKYRGVCSMKTWVYRITLNTCVSTIRKNRRNVSTVTLSRLYDNIDCDEEQKGTIAEIHECIACLNPIDKAVMMLWLEEESYDDIAGVTGLTRGNVAVRIHRAKVKLKTLITR